MLERWTWRLLQVRADARKRSRPSRLIGSVSRRRMFESGRRTAEERGTQRLDATGALDGLFLSYLKVGKRISPGAGAPAVCGRRRAISERESRLLCLRLLEPTGSTPKP